MRMITVITTGLPANARYLLGESYSSSERQHALILDVNVAP